MTGWGIVFLAGMSGSLPDWQIAAEVRVERVSGASCRFFPCAVPFAVFSGTGVEMALCLRCDWKKELHEQFVLEDVTMPTYTYQCTECGHAFDLFHGIMENGTRPCPVCGAEAKRRIGAGAGLIFKGSGFYETDYKRKGKGSDNGLISSVGSNGHAHSNGSSAESSNGTASSNGTSAPASESKKPESAKKTADTKAA